MNVRDPIVQTGVYLEAADVVEIKAHAARLNRSISWVTRRAWKIARPEIAALTAEERT